MTKTKELKNKGITLIALIITIIVMLILVAVTISMAINGGLFEKAGGAVSDTQNAIDKEQTLASGKVTIDGKEYNSIDEYIIGKDSKKSYDKAEKDANGFLLENATYESDGYTAVIPKGFKISDATGEKAIATGLVVIDKNDNEFVWIPVTTDLASSYTFSASDPLITEPAEVSDDIGRGYDFVSEYNQMVAGVNANNGFYIGRYETTGTVGGTNIGSKYNTQILYSNNWYDLYEEQKSANIEGNGTNIQTAMIYGVLWDETMAYITLKDKGYDVNTGKSSWDCNFDPPNSTVMSVELSLAGIKNTTDVALNIWGLTSNRGEWTQESGNGTGRIIRGQAAPLVNRSYGATSRGADYYNPNWNKSTYYGSRLVMYLPPEIEQTRLPSTTGTKPYYPSANFGQVSGTDLDNGLVIQDSEGNQYVWIEVPNDGTGPDYSSVSNSTDYENIENALLDYTSKYRIDFFGDYWYDGTGASGEERPVSSSSGSGCTMSTNLNDTSGCGLTFAQHTTLKHKMLTSIYENGGFWIGRYETSVAGTVQAGKTPKTNLTCAQASVMARGTYETGYERSLPFGIQRHLVMVHLEKKGVPTSVLAAEYSLNVNKVGLTGSGELGEVIHIYNLADNVRECSYERSSSNDEYAVTIHGGAGSTRKILFSVYCFL